jgi:hypothetical protein
MRGRILDVLKIAVLVFICSAVVVVARQDPAKQSPAATLAQKGAADANQTPVKDPSDKWLQDYDSYLALKRVIDNMKAQNGIDKLEQELIRQGNALAVQIPGGYTFDPDKKKFVLPPQPQATAPKPKS